MKKIFILLIVCITCMVIVLGCSKQNNEETINSAVHADYTIYEDENSLIDTADTIIIGKVVEIHEPDEIVIGKASHTPDSKDLSLVYTVSDVEIQKVIKGNYKAGDIIKVKQLGDITNPQYENSVKYYNQNSKNIFFLMTFPETPASVLNPIQGQIELVDDDKIKIDKENKLFSNAKNKDDIVNIIEKRVSSHNKNSIQDNLAIKY